MKGPQCWVTLAQSDAEGWAATVLARSIRNSLTTRPLTIAISENVTLPMKVLLQKEFDSVFRFDSAEVGGHANCGLLWLWNLRSWTKCVYVDANSYVLKNCDDLFQKPSFSAVPSQNGTFSTELFVFHPNVTEFDQLLELAQDAKGNVGKILNWNFKESLANSKNQIRDSVLWKATELGGNLNHLEPNMISFDGPAWKKTGTNDAINEIVHKWVATFVHEVIPHIKEMKDESNRNALMEAIEERQLPVVNGPLSTRPQNLEDLGPLKDAIAVVGMSCRFPGANNADEFWEVLASGKDPIRKYPADRPRPPSHRYTAEDEKAFEAGFLKCAVDEFDAKFFGISPREAPFVDPQQRILLEVIWESLENGNINPQKLRETNTGVFVGIWQQEYNQHFPDSIAFTPNEFHHRYLGNAFSATASRISHFLGLYGPNYSIESGCSSSSSAVHLACQSLRRGETTLAIASGVNLVLHFVNPIGGGDGDAVVLSTNFRCKTFDESADGFVRAEGCGAVVLKPLAHAMRDGDNVIGLIRGTALNNDGPATSFGTPNARAQERAYREALADAGVKPNEVSVVEAHGTGTIVGDPTEMYAIGQVYSEDRTEPLFVSSVKTNIGHSEACAGMAGLIKILLCLKNKQLPPHLHLEKLNPRINLETIPAIIPQQVTAWTAETRIAAVSSFSMSGTNVHLIVQETPEILKSPVKIKKVENSKPFDIITISAKSEEALEALCQKYITFLEENSTLNISDIAYTLNTGRANMAHRIALVAKDTAQVVSKLQSRSYVIAKAPTQKPKTIFLFTGQGSQYFSMGKNLYSVSTVFRSALRKCDTLFKKYLHCSLKHVLWEDATFLEKTIYCQPAIFSIQFALVQLWNSFGIFPDFVVGHSVGEFCASVCSGALTLEDAMRLVVGRSKLVDSLEGGKMMVVKTSPSETRGLIQEFTASIKEKDVWIDVAAENSMEEVVVSGTEKNVTDFGTFCSSRSFKTQLISASHAFHSREMDPVLPEFGALASRITPGKLNCRYISGTLARELSETDFDSCYWMRHLRDTVRFCDAVKYVNRLFDEPKVFVEVGSQPILLSLTMANVSSTTTATYCPSLRKSEDDLTCVLNSLSKMFVGGVDISWDKWYPEARKLSLPTYPFQRQKFWIRDEDEGIPIPPMLHPILGRHLPAPVSDHVFAQVLSSKELKYAEDHRVAEKIILPAAAYLETIMAAGCQILQGGRVQVPFSVENLQVEAALDLTKSCQIHTIVRSLGEEGDIKFEIGIHKQVSREDLDKWKRHAVASFSPSLHVAATEDFEIPKILDRLELVEKISEAYDAVAKAGIQFGPKFQSIIRAWKADSELLTEIEIPPDSNSYICHPIVLDAMIQTFALRNAIKSRDKQQEIQLQLPISIKKFTWFSREPTQKVFAYSTWTGDAQMQGTVTLLTETGETLGIMDGLELISTTVANFLRVMNSENNLLPGFFEEVWRPTSGITRNRQNPANFEIVGSTYVKRTYEDAGPTEQFNQTVQRGDNQFARFLVRAIIECKWPWGPIGAKIQTSDWTAVAPPGLLICKTSKLQQILADYDYLKEVGEDEFEILKNLPPLDQLEAEIEEAWKTEDDNIAEDSFSVEFAKRCGTYITPLLQGSVTPIAYLFPADPLEAAAVRYYHEGKGIRESAGLAAALIIDSVLSAHGAPGTLRILEVGAGSGAASVYALEGLAAENIPFQYTFTDISPLFLHEAKKKFTSKNITFSLFNIEEDPIGQGYAPEEFDIILANNVIHATADIQKTLKNLNLVLRNNGLLVLGEIFKDTVHCTLSFGFLDGWWRFTDDRKNSPLLNEEKWKTAFEKAGFEDAAAWTVFNDKCGAVIGRKRKNLPIEEILTPNSNAWLFVSDESQLEVNLKQRAELAGRKCLNFEDEVPEGLEAVIFLWTSPVLYSENQIKCQQLLNFCQKFIEKYQDIKVKPKFTLVTRGVSYLGDAGPGNPNVATSFSFVRTFANEHSDFSVAAIDLDQDEVNQEREVTELFATICSKEKEAIKAIREDKIFVQRLVFLDNRNLAIPMPNSNRFKITNPPSKSLHDLQISVAPKIEPVEDQVEVAIRATGLNFRDLFLILRPEGFDIPENINMEPGLDISGIISAVGPNCTKFQIGDAVFGSVPGGGLASHIITSSKLLIRKPQEMTFPAAATIPVAFLTVFYSFHELAKLSRGDRVLIHVATGGVGLAGIQMANHVGAEIFATAGSRRKRAYLRSIGIKHVYHSRNTDFGDEILKDTNGAGVDVILNSLTGPNFKEASLKACAQNGRFVEIGKMNIWTEEEVKSMRPDVKYFVVELAETSRNEPEKLNELAGTVEAEFEKGAYQGLPHEAFPLDMIREAFFYFQEAKHIGKIVINIPEAKVSPAGKIEFKNNLFHSQSTYMITGGLGGIGMEVAKWMNQSGATNLILVGRNPPSPSCQDVLDCMNKNGCRAVAMQADIGNYDECAAVLKSINDLNFPPLRGIMHAAGVLSDGIVVNQAWDKFEAVFKPKVNGTWNLHNLTSGFDLEFFTMFSSMVCIFGGPGQSNHAAANRFMDSFAHYRNSIGLPANSINFGGWSDVGVAANLKFAQDGYIGIKCFTPLQGLLSIERVLKTHRRQTVVAEVSDWTVLKQLSRLGNFFDEIKTATLNSTNGIEQYKAIIEEIKNATPETRQAKIEDFLEQALKETLRIPENEQLDRDQNFSEIGVDSLMAMELRNRLQGMLGDKQLTVSALQENRTIRSLSAHMANLMNSDASVVSVESLVAQDTILPADIRITTKLPQKPSEFKHILLTGGTGHLGVNLIPALQNENSNLVVHCIIRGKNSEDAENRLKKTLNLYSLGEKVNFEKIQILAGDLTKPNFDMTLEQFEAFAEKIDAIVHCAVKSNHLEEYNSFGEGSLRSNNVLATVNVLRFAATGKTKAVLYASSLLAATQVEENGCLVENFPAEEDFGTSIKNGYVLSKFVSEKLMSQALQRGIPVTVIRYASIVGNSITGFIPTGKNHSWSVMTSCFRIKKFPAMNQNGIPVMAVDTAAQVTAQIFLTDSMETGVYNLSGKSIISEEEMAAGIAKFGIVGEFVPFSEWRDTVFENVDKNELAPFFSLYGDDENTQAQAYLGMHPLATQIAALEFNSVSDKVRRNCPEFEQSIVSMEDLMQRHLQFHFDSLTSQP